MKSAKQYPPLSLLQTTSQKLPLAWERMESFHNDNGRKGLPEWESWCYAPMAAAFAVANNVLNNSDNMEAIAEIAFWIQIIAALAPWRLSKEVFIFDPELESTLYEQAEDLTIPAEILLQLPYPAFYVQTSHLTFDSQLYHGFFVHLEHDINTGGS